MSQTTTLAGPRVLADLIPATTARTIALVAAGAALVAVASQVRIPLGFTPVPINGGTFAVMVVGAGLGLRRGGAALGVYLLAGLIGIPVFADLRGGVEVVTGATGGYLVGYLVAALLVGAAAEHRADRRVRSAIPAMLVGTAAIYALGALWLARYLDISVLGNERSAWTLGVRPFLAGDAVKLVLAGLVLPAAWRVAGSNERR
jgi:biotin transport system substrate-specific component